jgi:small-conductance mechanosensitive channel
MANGVSELFQQEFFQLALKIVAVLIIAFILKLISGHYFKIASKRVQKYGSKEEAKIKKTRISLLKKFVSALIFIGAIIGILFFVPGFKNAAYSLLAGAGIVAVVIGFAAQKTLANVMSGISIALYSPFRVGDKLKIFEEYGIVEDISLRHTVIKTWDNKRLVIPNSLIDDKEIINYSLHRERVLWTINMGISYDSDIDEAKEIMLNLAKKHENNIEFEEFDKHSGKKAKREPFVRVTGCGDFAVNIRLYYWCEDAWIAWKMGYDLTEQIKKEFDKKGIEIPFPYRTIVYKKDMDKKE